MQERRQNVRVRPTPDYDIKIEYEEGLVKVRLSILDLAVGGIGILVDELFLGVALGTSLRVVVTLPDFETFETEATLRHSTGRAGGRCGFHFASLTHDQQKAWSRAVSELLERGHSA
jgi:c-di-GMP-binding flagellar brake protein YcgR